MADFIAVIRRAVDGLSDDTPEMRAKVYEKARSAVQRQLDNMNPKPADEMIARQMAKLAEAIDLVESEHVGTAAAEPEISVAEPVEAAPPPRPEAPPASGPEAEPEAEPPAQPEPETSEAGEPATETVEEETEEPAAPEQPQAEEEPEPEAETAAAAAAEEPSPETETGEPHAEQEPAWDTSVEDNPFEEPSGILAPQQAQTEELPEPLEPDHVAGSPEDILGNDGSPGGPVPAWVGAGARDLWPEIDETPNRQEPAQPEKAEAPDEWENFEKIIGYDRTARQPPAEHRKPPSDASLEIADAISHLREHSVETEPAPSDNGSRRAPLVGAILALLVVLLGVGYAGWHYSDRILALVNGSGGSKVASQTGPDTAGQQTAAPPAQQIGAEQKAKPSQAEEPQKFTQRLMPDGSEVDTGNTGEPTGNASTTQATSMAGPSQKDAQAGATQETADNAPQQTAGNATAKPVKMFLYEERLGQASPTALDGTVTWSVQTDKESGSSQKAIEADIEVPGRKLSAVMTIKRNTDPSLPASHIIELTFSLPKDFEGGGIENVLRIAMKQNEQDQGDPLIAVPAKITDYFHMVALNAYPDAVKTNLELLKTRDWIDIPITYSNGRRALLTLQKGPEGEKVFNEVLADWANATPPAAPPASEVPVPSPEPAQTQQ